MTHESIEKQRTEKRYAAFQLVKEPLFSRKENRGIGIEN